MCAVVRSGGWRKIPYGKQRAMHATAYISENRRQDRPVSGKQRKEYLQSARVKNLDLFHFAQPQC